MTMTTMTTMMMTIDSEQQQHKKIKSRHSVKGVSAFKLQKMVK